MKPLAISRPLVAGLLTALLVVTSAALAAERDGTSPATFAKLCSVLPAFPAAAERPAVSAPVRTTTPPVPDIVLTRPETVQRCVVRPMVPESLYRHGYYDQELVRRELTRFDRFFLNRITLPLVGVPPEIRARQIWLNRRTAEFHDEVNQFARNLQVADPREAAALRMCLQSWP